MIGAAEHEWLKAMIAFLYLYGCRVSEALKLSYGSFSLEGNYLSVKIGVLKRHSDAGPITPSHVLKVNTKSPFMDILINYIKANARSEKLWLQHRGHVWRKIKELNTNCSPHFFRHTRLWRLASKGASEAVLMDWAGWTDPRPAGRYIRATGRLASQFADKID
jgi:integrase